MPASQQKTKPFKDENFMRKSATCFPLLCTAGRARLEFIFCAKTKFYSACVCVTRSVNQITAAAREKGGCAFNDTSRSG